MSHSRYNHTRVACAYFFFAGGLAYGIFTARLPAYRSITGANDSEIGLLLLCFGIFSLIALSTASRLIARFGVNNIIVAATLLMLGGWMLTGIAHSPLALVFPLAIAGLGTGLCDVAMNAAGIETEQKFKVHCMSFLHAAYSLGGVSGALCGSLFAALNLGPLPNLLAVLGPYLLLIRWARRNLLPQSTMRHDLPQKSRRGAMPFFIFFSGFLAMLCYMAEGSVGEWGSLFLYTDKGASAEIAALVFGAFSTPMVIGRLMGDSLRDNFGDFPVLCAGASLGAAGMAIAIFTPWPVIALGGYALMGLGMAPVVPIIFSRAGSRKGVNTASAVAVVSTMAYSGLLFFPPLLGFLGNAFGLSTALLIPLAACAIVAAGSLALR